MTDFPVAAACRAFVVAVALSAGCGGRHALQLYPGEPRSASDMAVVELPQNVVLRVFDESDDAIELRDLIAQASAAGHHELARSQGEGVFRDAMGEGIWAADVALIPGRYRLVVRFSGFLDAISWSVVGELAAGARYRLVIAEVAGGPTRDGQGTPTCCRDWIRGIALRKGDRTVATGAIWTRAPESPKHVHRR